MSNKNAGAYQKLIEYNTAVIESWIKQSRIPAAMLQQTSPDYATVGVRINGKNRVFGLCFGKVRRHREFKISPRFFDAFGKNDKIEIELLKLLNFFVEHMGDIQKELIDNLKAKKLYNAWDRACQKLFGKIKK